MLESLFNKVAGLKVAGSVTEVFFYVNNLTASIMNTRYKIFMPKRYVYCTNKPIHLTLFQNPLQTGQVSSLFVNITFFFDKDTFLFDCFYWLFCFQFWFVLFRLNIIFVSFGYLSLVLLQFSFTK